MASSGQKRVHKRNKEENLRAKELTGAKKKEEIINEIVDIQELIDVLISQLGLTKLKIQKHQKIKSKKRGGFIKWLFLIKTEK